MQKVKCLLCGHDAEEGIFSSEYNDKQTHTPFTGGSRYNCPECGRYALDGYALGNVKMFVTNEKKRKISEYVKTHQLKNEFLLLEWDTIKKILNQINTGKKGED